MSDNTYSRMTVAELQSLADTRKLSYTSKTRKPALIELHERYDAFTPDIEPTEDEVKAAFEVMSTPVRHGALPMSAEEKIEKYQRSNLMRMGFPTLTVKQRRVIRRTLNRGRSVWKEPHTHPRTGASIASVDVKRWKVGSLDVW